VVRVTALPFAPVAVLTTVYDVPGSSSAPAVQLFLFAVIWPLMAPDLELTETDVRVPLSAVTVTRWSTATAVAPLATLVCRTGLGTFGAALFE